MQLLTQSSSDSILMVLSMVPVELQEVLCTTIDPSSSNYWEHEYLRNDLFFSQLRLLSLAFLILAWDLY